MMISGLTLHPDFITPAEEKDLLDILDAQPWRADFQRRVQHYGYRYDYKARQVTSDLYLGPLPSWLQGLAERLTHSGLFPDLPDQVIVNEYLPGQGIAPHIDCVPCFGGVIASLSLASDVVMDFGRPDNFRKTAERLPARSLLVMSGPARYHWQHGIAKRKTDVVDGEKIIRQRRVSLTFRCVVMGG
jgi:alkylated DNA repair dioxygenase AlkB